MPYIIEVTRSEKTERAVVTLEEARAQIMPLLELGSPDRPNHRDAHKTVAAIQDLPEAGGSVGPLPDGTVIEVVFKTTKRLVDEMRHAMLAVPAHWHLFGADAAEVVDAYNAAQAVASLCRAFTVSPRLSRSRAP